MLRYAKRSGAYISRPRKARMVYAVTCGDEGVQLNEGKRVAVVGAGVKLEGFQKVVPLLKKIFGKELVMASSAENDWIKNAFDLDEFEQADATMQQQVEALADKVKLPYSGFLPFADPKPLKHDLKGHMVRPKGIHIANKISFTVAGGEGTYNLGNFVISADWLHLADKKLAEQVLMPQAEHWKAVAGGRELQLMIDRDGEVELSDDAVEANVKMLQDLGFAVE